MIIIDGCVFGFYKNWKLPYFPQIGHSIEVGEMLTEQEMKIADETVFRLSGLGKGGVEVTLKDIFVDNYSTVVKHISWTLDSVEIELKRKGMKDARIVKMGRDYLNNGVK